MKLMTIANELNHYFVYVGPKLASSTSLSTTNKNSSWLHESTSTYSNTLYLSAITSKEVEHEISEIKQGKSAGP